MLNFNLLPFPSLLPFPLYYSKYKLYYLSGFWRNMLALRLQGEAKLLDRLEREVLRVE